MKKMKLLFNLFAAMMLLWGIGAKAQTNVSVSSEAELQAAYAASQTGTVGETTTIEITNYFSITSDFAMNPSSDHPVVIQMDTSFVTGTAGVNTVFEGALTINTPTLNNVTGRTNLALIVGGNTTFGQGLIFNDNVIGQNSSGIDISTNATLTINGGTYTTTNTTPGITQQGSLIYITTTAAGASSTTTAGTLIINDGNFNIFPSVTAASANIRVIQSTGANVNITINGGNFQVGTGGRVIYFNGGSAKATITSGTFKVGSSATSYIASVNTGSGGPYTVGIAGGTFDVGTGILFGLGQANTNVNPSSFVLKGGDITAGTLCQTSYSGSSPVQKFYDFRGYVITATPAPEEISVPITVSLNLPATITPDPVDAAGLTTDDIYYYITDVNDAKSTPAAYTAPIAIQPGETLTAYIMTATGFTSNEVSFPYTKGETPSATVTTFTELKAAIQALEDAGTGGLIQLGDNLTVKSGASPTGDETGGADHEALLSSTVPVVIDCGNYQIISNGTGSSGTSVKLTIGANITVTGIGAPATVSSGVTKNVLINTVANGRVHIGNGGKVSATGDVAINGMAGRLSMEPGAWVEINSDGGIAIQSTQNFTVWFWGGTIKATGAGATALCLGGNPGTAHTIKDLTIIANGNGAIGFYAEPLATGAAPGRYVLQGSTSITTTSTAKTDIGISVTAGVLTTGSVVVLPADNTGGVSSTGTPYSIDATTGAAILDLTRPIDIIATPGAGTTPAGPVTLKAEYTDNNSLVAIPVYYTFGATATDPTTSSSSMANGGTFDLTDDGTLTAGYITPGITYTVSGYETSAPVTSSSTVYSAPTPFPSFTYEIGEAPATPVTTFAELRAAIQALEDAGTGGTIQLGDNITVNSGASPAGDETGGVDHEALLSSTVPVTIDCDDYQIISSGTGSSGTSVKLTIGNNITVVGIGTPSTVSSGVTKNVLINTVANGRVHIGNGGKVSATGDVAINGMAGRLSMEPGSWVEINSDGGVAIQSTQNFTVWFWGGTIKATGAGATALYLGGLPGTAHTIKDVTIIADGDGATGFHAEPLAAGSAAGRYVLQGSTSITTTSTEKTDVGISVTAGALASGSIVVIPTDNTGGVSSTGMPYSIDATPGAAVLDLTRPINIFATPGAGNIPAGPVILKAEYTDDNSLVAVPVYYTTDGTQPATTSTSVANGGTYNFTADVTLTAGYITPGITYTVSGYATSAPVASASTVYSAPTPFPSFIYTILTGIVTPLTSRGAYISGNTLYLSEAGQVQVYNVSGQLILDSSVSGATIDVSSLNKGVYIVKTGSGTFKAVKQ